MSESGLSEITFSIGGSVHPISPGQCNARENRDHTGLPAVKQIAAGAILANVDFNIFEIGSTPTRAAVRHLSNEPRAQSIPGQFDML